MSEFNNRIDAQRQILRIVNSVGWRDEPLFGLSGKALERWVSRNGLHPETPLVRLLHTAAAELFFLANRSQEQVTEEYQTHAHALGLVVPRIAAEVAQMAI